MIIMKYLVNYEGDVVVAVVVITVKSNHNITTIATTTTSREGKSNQLQNTHTPSWLRASDTRYLLYVLFIFCSCCCCCNVLGKTNTNNCWTTNRRGPDEQMKAIYLLVSKYQRRHSVTVIVIIVNGKCIGGVIFIHSRYSSLVFIHIHTSPLSFLPNASLSTLSAPPTHHSVRFQWLQSFASLTYCLCNRIGACVSIVKKFPSWE